MLIKRLIGKLFGQLDRLAGWWLDFRTGQVVKSDPDLQKFDLHKAEFNPGSSDIVAFAPGVVALADQAAKLLTAQHAENYIQFELMPRLDRGMPPILVTVQWAAGLSPAKKNAMLTEELAVLRQYFDPDDKRPNMTVLELAQDCTCHFEGRLDEAENDLKAAKEKLETYD